MVMRAAQAGEDWLPKHPTSADESAAPAHSNKTGANNAAAIGVMIVIPVWCAAWFVRVEST
jgi:hypothetical protein